MMANDTHTAKWNDKIMEKNEGLRTLDCLRGRLLAERAASKAANDESEQIAKKVIELEKQLKMEIKSRNKAEKRLNFLMKKLDSLNISYVSADESSCFSEISEISSVSSSKSQNQELQKLLVSEMSKCVMDSDTSGKRQNCPSQEDSLGSLDEAISENSQENYVIQSSPKNGDEDDNNGLKSHVTKNNVDNEGHNQDIDDYNVDNLMALVIVDEINAITTPKKDEDCNANFDNSMALVAVNSITKEEQRDIPMLNNNVKDVLDALRYARESLQTSMEMRKHTKKSNIDQARLNRISC